MSLVPVYLRFRYRAVRKPHGRGPFHLSPVSTPEPLNEDVDVSDTVASRDHLDEMKLSDELKLHDKNVASIT